MFTQPVTGKDFFGRNQILSLLAKRANDLKAGYRQNIALTGQMLCGKTSILKYFLNMLDNTDLIPVYVDVAETGFEEFSNKFLGTLLFSLLRKDGHEISYDNPKLEMLQELASQKYPKTNQLIETIKQLTKKKKYTDAYKSLFQLTSLIKEESGKLCVVVLDEFHNIETFKIKNPFMLLGKIIMLQKDTLYVVSSSQRITVKKILSEKLSLLFGNFEVCEVRGFSRKISREFIRERISPVDISDYYIDYILNITEKKPFYLHLFCKAVVELSKKSEINRVNVELLKDIFFSLLYEQTGTINQVLINHVHFLMEKSKRKNYLEALIALSKGFFKLKDIALYLKQDERQIAERLEELVAMDFVGKVGMFYFIQDKFFGFWLRNVYLPRESSFLGSNEDRKREFGHLVDSDIEGYLIEYNKGIFDRLKELFMMFKGEFVEVDKKRRKIPCFSKAEILRYGDDLNYIFCETEKKYWVYKIKKEQAKEKDIVDFLKKTGTKNNKISRRILITLSQIDQDAVLLAKAKNIWVWDLNTINMLFRLFNRQDLII